jgi:hypothetical protein
MPRQPGQVTAVNVWTQTDRWAGTAAIAGGAMYAVKAAVILLGHNQPPLLFEAAPLAFGICLALLGRELRGRAARAALILALAIIVCTGANMLELLLTDREIVPAISSLIDAVTGFGPLVGLFLLAWASRQPEGPVSWRSGILALAGLYPLVILAFIPVGFFVDLDGDTGERLIELPILAIGLGWVVFGASLIGGPARGEESASVPGSTH